MALNQRFFNLTILTFLLVIVVVPSRNVDAATFTAFGPKDFARATGEPATETDLFSVLNPNTSYTIHIYNGGKLGQFQKKVSSAVIRVNDVLIIEPEDFGQNIDSIERPVTLKKENELSIELRSAPGSGLTVEIIGVDNEPPRISADIIPPPNAYGWNNTDVTVEFTCLDTISGIASCPDPVSVQTEDSAQVISGTAIDYAGNTSSASVIINLDKTPPQIAESVIPPPDAAGWHNTDVTVEFTCSDTMSGIATCTDAVLVQTEDSAQVISGTAIDYAGNTSSTSVIINLDKTSPVVTITNPLPDEILQTSPVNVKGLLFDNLSGIDLVTLNDRECWEWSDTTGTFSTYMPLEPGENSIDFTVLDMAGNIGNTSMNVTYSPADTSQIISLESIKKFAPQLRFDSRDFDPQLARETYPMSAQDYYAVMIDTTDWPIRYDNNDRSTVENNLIPTYWDATFCGKQIRIFYWWFYGYQEQCTRGCGTHHGDWEHVMVILSEDRTRVAAVTYYQHAAMYTRIPATGKGTPFEDTHPIVYVGRTQHGSFHNTMTWTQTCCYWEDHRDGKGPKMNCWLSPLIRLEPGGEAWMDRDLIGDFRWGPGGSGGVSTHPVKDRNRLCCGMMSCAGTPSWGCHSSGCYRSECQVGDDSRLFTCWHCAAGYTDIGLLCAKCWWIFCRFYGIKAYSHRYPIPTSDKGLLYKNPGR